MARCKHVKYWSLSTDRCSLCPDTGQRGGPSRGFVLHRSRWQWFINLNLRQVNIKVVATQAYVICFIFTPKIWGNDPIWRLRPRIFFIHGLVKNHQPDMDVSKIGVPQNGWFIMENPIKMDDLGVPLFSETSIIWIVHSKSAFLMCVAIHKKLIHFLGKTIGPSSTFRGLV